MLLSRGVLTAAFGSKIKEGRKRWVVGRWS